MVMVVVFQSMVSDVCLLFVVFYYVGIYSDLFLGDVVVLMEGDLLWLCFGCQMCMFELCGGDVFDCQWQVCWCGGGDVIFVVVSLGRIGLFKFVGQELQCQQSD